jgi:RimJ/RimL family protein N-acetyltransferase
MPHAADSLTPPLPLAPVPILMTERLTMRGHRLDDLDDCYALWSDPIGTRYTTGRPQTEEEVWTRLLRYVGHWALMGFGYWMVRETTTDRFVGEVGFADYHRAIVPSVIGVPELGWVLMRDMQGRGLATEAVQAALAWGEQQFHGGRTVCIIDPQNEPSLRVADKVGYREFARTLYKDQPIVMFER